MTTQSVSAPTLGMADWGRLVVLSVFWGGSFLFIKIAVTELPPLLVVLARVSIGAAALHLAAQWTRTHIPWDRSLAVRLLVLGLLNNAIPFSLIFFGQREIPAGLGAILNSTMPIFSVVLAHYLTHDEPMTGPRIVGVLMGRSRRGCLNGLRSEQRIRARATRHGRDHPGLCELRRRSYLYAPLPRALVGGVGGGQLICASVVLLPLVLVIDRPWSLPLPSMSAILAILALAILCTSVAYLLYFRVIKSSGASNASLVTLLIQSAELFSVPSYFMNPFISSSSQAWRSSSPGCWS